MTVQKRTNTSDLAIILFLIIVFPIGLLMMWKFAQWKRMTKILITGVVLAIFGILVSSKPSKNTVQEAITLPTTTVTVTTAPQITDNPQQIPSQEAQNEKTYLVLRVIDGDTIEIEGNKRLRYIGIDTPELNQDECFAQEATDKNRALVEGKQVFLEKDISETDKYGRLLRYVYVLHEGNKLFINQELIEKGYAVSSSYPPDVKYQDILREAQQKAIKENVGLWKAGCNSKSKAIIPTTSSQININPTQSSNTGNCVIKGNISSTGEKIFHVPGCQSYTKTGIDTSVGERWFCTEQEAIQAGWRKAKNCP